MKYLLLLLLSFNVHAECFPDLLPLESPQRWCKFCWVAPTERTNNTPLALSELWGYKAERKNAQGTWDSIDVVSTSTGFYWYSDKDCPACTDLRIMAIDTDLRESIFAYPTCPPATPIVCI